MAKKETVKDKKIKALLADLSGGDEKKQVAAVQSLKVHGNESVIEPLLQVLVNAPGDQLKSEIVDLLNTTKSTHVPEKIAAALVDEEYAPIHQVLLSAVWNSGLDYRPYLREIVTAGTKGDMMTALECITIIENIEGELTEDEIFEPLIILREYITENKEQDGAKMDMLKEITLTLQNRNNLL